MIYLKMLAGSRKGDTLTIEEKPIIRVGRDPECDVHLTDDNVSRVHAKLIVDGNDVVLVDCDSTNSCFVNGKRTAKMVIGCDDVVALGASVFKIERTPKPGAPVGPTHIMSSSEKLMQQNAGELPQMSRYEEYQKLFECMLAIQKTLSMGRDGMIEESLQALFLVLPVTRLSLLRVLPDNNLTDWYATGKHGDEAIHMSRTFAKKVLEADKAILIHDAIALDESEWGQTIQEQAVRSIIGVPVHALGKVAAVLLCDNLIEPNILQDIHVKILEFVSKALETVFQRDALRTLEENQADTERLFVAAKRVQRQILNRRPPTRMGALEWALHYQPALDVGGDFFAFDQREESVFWLIADVSGKGIPAALVVSMLKGFCKVLFPQHLSPKQFLVSLSELLDQELPEYMFLTAFAMQIDNNGLITYVNAGHPPGLIVRKDASEAEVIKLSSSGNPIGFVPTPEFAGRLLECSVQMTKGDSLCVYTDGVTEARSPSKDFFGDNKFFDALVRLHGARPEEHISALLSQLEEFQCGHQADDITLLVGTY